VDNPGAPKYINTPSTPLYDKSRHVFGMHLAKDTIRKSKFVVMAEGNLDVIQSHQAGVRQVVATAGTALTEPHLKALSRLTGDIRLCFDADKAGLAATERAIPVAAKVGVSLSIITIPSGKDPDELIKQDVRVWQDIITRPQYAVDWLIERYAGLLDIDTAMGKRELSDVVLQVVRQLPDPVEQDHYMGKLADLLSVNKQALTTKLAGVPDETVPIRQRQIKPQSKQAFNREQFETERNEEHFLALVLLQPKLRPLLHKLTADMISNEEGKKVFKFLVADPDYDGTDKAAVQEFAEYVKILSLVYETLYQDLEPTELAPEANRLQAKLIARYVQAKKQQLITAMQSADPEQSDQLLQQVAKLNELLRTTQGGA
jgi:DNA primase